MAELTHPGDSQKIELLGRNRLIDELLRADLEVALPIRDRGIDLIAYADFGEGVQAYASCPIQMKASWTQGFGVDQKYAKFPNLILAYIWNLRDSSLAVTYAMSYAQACAIAESMDWTQTSSWKRGAYSTSRPTTKLIALLEPYMMTVKAWRELIVNAQSAPA
ncbi:MAG: hypothetical protein QM796_20695 [Chthoniobacteraceae bacterium]